MSKRRYHYDAKGKLRGFSSNLPPFTIKDFFLVSAILAGVALFSTGRSEEKGVEDAPLLAEHQAEHSPVAPIAPIAEESPLTEQMLPEASPNLKVETEDAPSNDDVTGVTDRDYTAEYMEREYVNSDPNCPRVMIEYHQKQCAAGDESSCPFAICGSLRVEDDQAN